MTMFQKVTGSESTIQFCKRSECSINPQPHNNLLPAFTRDHVCTMATPVGANDHVAGVVNEQQDKLKQFQTTGKRTVKWQFF